MDNKHEESFSEFWVNELKERVKINNSYQWHKEAVDNVKKQQLDLIAQESSKCNKRIDENLDMIEDALSGADPRKIKESLRKITF